MATPNDNPFVEKYLTPIAVLLGAIIIAVAFAFGSGERPPQSGEPVAQVVDIKDVTTDTSPSVGSMDAPVVIATWFDYQCGHCQNFERQALAEVYEEYVVTGQVRIVHKDFQFFGEESERLSAFGRAVYEANPESFRDWKSAVMAAQTDQSFGTASSIEALSATIPGVDVARVKALLAEKSEEYAAAAAADRAEGQSFGITGTPGTIIGTELIGGAQPYSALKLLIDAELQN